VAKKNMDVFVRLKTAKFLITGIAAVSMLSIGVVVFSQWLISQNVVSHSFEQNTSLLRLTQLVQQEVTTAHLWLEEALGSDSSIDIHADVHARLGKVLRLIDSGLQGDDTATGRIDPLPSAREGLLKLRENIAELDMLVDIRWAGRESTGVISGEEDQAFDALFADILAQSGAIGDGIGDFIAADQRKMIAIKAGILITLAVLFSTMLILITWSRRMMDAKAIALDSHVQQRTANPIAPETEAQQGNGDIAMVRDQAHATSKVKSQFLANMSHEIRTPMNGIIGMANLLLRTELTQAQKEYVDTLNSSGLSLLAAINNFLNFLKAEAITPDFTDVPVHTSVDNEENFASDIQPPKNSGYRSSLNRKVLVVDDNMVNRLVAQRMLEELGFEVDLADNGLEAIDAATAGEDYAAILIDIQMPGMDGNEATRIIRLAEGDKRHTPIIALTANTMTPGREKALAAGMDDYMCKPIFLEDLEAALSRNVISRSPSMLP